MILFSVAFVLLDDKVFKVGEGMVLGLPDHCPITQGADMGGKTDTYHLDFR